MDRRTMHPGAPGPGFGYSQVVAVSGGRTIYVAGQVAFDESGTLVGAGDFEAQVRQAFLNLKLALEAAGSTPSDIVKLGIFVVGHDAKKLVIVRETRDAVLGIDADPPASTLLGVETLALPELLFEVDAVAVVA